MSRPEDKGDVGELSQSNASSAAAASGAQCTATTPATDADRQGNRPTTTAADNGANDRSVPTTTDEGGEAEPDYPLPVAALRRIPSCHRRGGGVVGTDRAYQFRKAKSAATFTLDGISYTIGE